MLNDDRIAELLQANERTHTMLDDERARIRHALNQADELGPDDDVGRLLDISADGQPADRRRRGPVLLLAAAAVVLIAGLALTLTGNAERPVRTLADAPETQIEPPAPTSLPTPDPLLVDLLAGQAFCAGPFSDLAEAIAGWDGITNWSYLTTDTNTEPHIPSFSTVVLDDLDAIIDADELKVSRSELEQALSLAGTQPGGFTAEIRVVVADALISVVDSVRGVVQTDLDAGFARFGTCDLATFTADG